MDAYFDGIFGSKKLAVIGCGCSVATEPVAEISHQWNISHVSSVSGILVVNVMSIYNVMYYTVKTEGLL